MLELSLSNQLPRHVPQLHPEFFQFFVRLALVRRRPGATLAKHPRPDSEVALDDLARGRMLLPRVQRDVLATRAADGREAEDGRLNAGDAVEGVSQVVSCVRFLRDVACQPDTSRDACPPNVGKLKVPGGQ